MAKKYTARITERFLQAEAECIRLGLVASKKEFAEQMGDYPSNILSMQTGRRSPTLEQLATLCIKYKFNPTWLLLGEGEQRITASAQKITLEHRLQQLENTVSALALTVSKLKKSRGTTGAK